MNHDIELAYVGIEVPEPSSLASFFGTVIGLLPGEPTVDGAMTWRNDDKAHRLIVRPGPANDAVFVGFEAVDDAAFDNLPGEGTIGRDQIILPRCRQHHGGQADD